RDDTRIRAVQCAAWALDGDEIVERRQSERPELAVALTIRSRHLAPRLQCRPAILDQPELCQRPQQLVCPAQMAHLADGNSQKVVAHKQHVGKVERIKKIFRSFYEEIGVKIFEQQNMLEPAQQYELARQCLSCRERFGEGFEARRVEAGILPPLQ